MKRTPKRTGWSRRLRAKPCTYCGRTPAGSVDHVPPECFFQPPLPSNLITVPCCRPCNEKFSLDDLYVHLTIMGRQDVGSQPRFSTLAQMAIERLEAPSNLRLRMMMAKSFVHGDVRLQSRVIVPRQDVLMIDRPRLIRWLERIFRGLHYHETKQRIPDDFEIEVTLGEDGRELVQNCVGWFRDRPLRTSGNATFEYKWMPVSDRPEASIWCIEFYHVMPVVGIIRPPLTEEEKAASLQSRQAAGVGDREPLDVVE